MADIDIEAATRAIQAAMDYLADMHGDDAGCRFYSAVETDDIGCLSCLAQTQLADATLILNPEFIGVGMRAFKENK